MSDNNVPSAFIAQFGADAEKAMDLLGKALEKSKLKEISDKLEKLDSGTMNTLSKTLELWNTTAKDMGDAKTRTGLKQFGMSLATMASSQLIESLGLMEGISSMFEAMFSPLSLVSPLLQVIAAIIQEAYAPTLQEMAPYIQMAAQYLIEHKDSIIAFIQVTTPAIGLIAILTGNVSQLTEAFKATGIDLNLLNTNFIVITQTIGLMTQGFSTLQSGFVEFEVKLQSIGNEILDIPNKLGSLGGQIKDVIRDWSDDFEDALKDVRDDMYDEIKGWGKKLLKALKKALGL